ncbi:MAG: hypothetical protein LBF97_06105 [Elusimicrobiota bacterium]|jgi:hypothetical protein|nr:hypothetical protein [Elusimicrobiota bacterium]
MQKVMTPIRFLNEYWEHESLGNFVYVDEDNGNTKEPFTSFQDFLGSRYGNTKIITDYRGHIYGVKEKERYDDVEMEVEILFIDNLYRKSEEKKIREWFQEKFNEYYREDEGE